MKEDILLFRRVWGVVRPFHRRFFILFLFLLTHSIFTLFSPLFWGKGIDALTLQNFNHAYIYIVIGIIFSFILRILELFWDKFEIKNINTKITGFFSVWSLNQIFKLSLGQFRGENSGYRQKIFEKGIGAMERTIGSIIYNVGIILLRSFVTSIALFFINVWLGTIVLFALIIYIYFSIYINKSLKNDFKKNQEVWAQEGREYTESLRYLSFIKSNAQESKAIKFYKEIFGKVTKHSIPLWVNFVTKSFWRENVIIVARGATIILGLWMTINGDLTIGSLVIFSSWSSTVFGGLNNIGHFHRNLIKDVAEIKKLFEILDEPSDVLEIDNPIKLKEVKDKIEFKDVTFSYPARKKGNDDEDDDEEDGEKKKEDKIESEKKDEPVLLGVNFTIEAGKTTAFVGRSGSGKTTIINLLLRAYDPQQGQIIIDGIDLKDLDLKDYRKKIGVVEQEVEVFDKTVRHNILFPIDDVDKFTDADLEKISKDSGMDEFKDRLTHGYDTKIGEKGIQLSGGQKQRVGIARVLAKKPLILIFDEATSNLDSVNEKKIHKAMKKALKGRTGIIIAHRLATVMDADKIVVFERGRVVGDGTHQELLKKCKQYKELVKLQCLELAE